MPGRLAHHQLGRGRQLVGHRHLGDVQLAAVGVGGAPQVDHGGDAGAADGDVGEAPPPGPAERVGHDHRHLPAGAGPEAVADAAGGAVGVDREEGGVAVGDVGQVDAGVGAHEPAPRLGDDQVAPAAQHPHRLGLDHRGPGVTVVVVDGHHPPLRLRHHLLGDDHHVPVLERNRRGHQQVGQDVAGTDLGHPLDGDDLEPAHQAPRTVVGQGRRLRPAPHDGRGHHAPHALVLHRPRQPAVGLVDDQHRRQGGVQAGDAHHRHVVAQVGQEAGGGALQGGAGHDGRHRHHVRPAGHDRLLDAGHGQDRVDRHDRVRRADHDPVGVGAARPARPARAERPPPPRTAPPARARRGGGGRSSPGTRSPPRRAPRPGWLRDRRSSAAGGPLPPRQRRSPPSPSTGAPPRAAGGCGRGGWPGRGRRGGTR